MKNILAGVLAVLGLGWQEAEGWQQPVPVRSYPNVVYNGSFEQEDWFYSIQPDGWLHRANAGRVTGVAHTGRASLHIRGPNASYTIHQPFLLPTATTYWISFWARGNVTAGKGVRLTCNGMEKGTDWLKPTADWQQAVANYTSPQQPLPHAGTLVLSYNLMTNEEMWVDDIEVVSVDGKLAEAPAPLLQPAGGEYGGPVLVTLTSLLPRAQIRYTLDGTEPNRFSTLYEGPVSVDFSTTVKARTIAEGWREGPAAVATYQLKERLSPGVPLSPVQWEEPVAAWWARHPYNPKTGKYRPGTVISPEPRINVADMHKQHPESQTAGIEEALKLLPPEGGTLFFPKDHGPYMVTKPEVREQLYYYTQGAILIARRSNLHFVSDGAVIQCPWILFGISGRGGQDGQGYGNPVRNFYFKGLTFDGQGTSDIAINFMHCADILFENCTFRNYAYPGKPQKGKSMPSSWSLHPAPLTGTVKTDNLWCLDCTFEGSYACVYLDGIHNGGFVRCKFLKGQIGLMIFTNNDMAIYDCITRNGQYLVVSDCDFDSVVQGLNLSASHVLVENSRQRGGDLFFGLTGRHRSSIELYVWYEIYDVQLSGNQLDNVKAFSLVTFPCQQFVPRPPSVFEHNTASNLNLILDIDPKITNANARISQIIVRSNVFAGASMPCVQVNRARSGQVQNVLVTGNSLSGAERPAVQDEQGKPLQAPAVIFKGNTMAKP